MITQDQLKDVLDRAEKLKHYLKIDQKQMEYEEEDLRTQAPDFWDDRLRAEAQMKKVKSIKRWIDGYNEVRTMADELQLAFDFYKDEMVTEEEVDEAYQKAIKAIENLELMNMLRQQEDPMDAVLKINSGAGGTEAQDWASMLMRMYIRWAEAHGYKVTIANLLDGDEAGIKSVTMQIEGGEYAYGYLKSENGVHRLVRVSPFNAQGKRMTSFASVFVTPLVDDTIEVYVDPAKLSWAETLDASFFSHAVGIHDLVWMDAEFGVGTAVADEIADFARPVTGVEAEGEEFRFAVFENARQDGNVVQIENDARLQALLNIVVR